MKVLKTLRLENDLVEFIKSKGQSENRNFTNMVETILEEWRKKENKAA